MISKMAYNASKHHAQAQDKPAYNAPVKATLWNGKRWDSKCTGEFAEYTPPLHARLGEKVVHTVDSQSNNNVVNSLRAHK